MANEWLGGSIGRSSHSSKQNWGGGWKDEYFDGNNLKPGYESRFLGNGDNVSGQGAIAVYTNDYDDMWDSYEPMRDKANYGIFQTGPTAAQQQSGGGGEPQASPRNTGEYDDIIGALQDDVNAANARANDFSNRQAQQVADQTAALSAQFDQRLAELTAGFTERYGALEGMFQQQNSQMQQFQTQMQGQMQQAQANYDQQVVLMQNIQKSRVPEAETNAFTAQVGDLREDTTRKKENNRLSDLSILSGLGTQSSPTSGLSLA